MAGMDNKDHNVTPTDDPREFWDARYASASSVWSGQVNAALAAVVEPLDPGSALDLGSGEGGDVCWLAQRGWFATGVELSAVAVERARKLAEAAGCQDRARFIADDLTTWRPPSGQRYDLITASFLQSPVRLERASILREISRYLTPGGRMVILAHAKPPAWLAGTGCGPSTFYTPDEDLAALELDPNSWVVERADTVEREAAGPEGQPGVWEDSVIVVRAA